MIKYKTPTLMVIIALVLLVHQMPLFAQNALDFPEIPAIDFSRTARSGWQFLHLPTNARNAALANIKCGLNNNNAMAVFANPADLVNVKNIDIGFSKFNYIADVSFMTAAIAKNFEQWGVFGIQFASLSSGDMIRTENRPGRFGNERFTNLGTFDAGDLLIGVSYARTITDRFSIGANVNYIEETLDDVKASNISLDFGLYFKTGFKSLRFAIVGRNLGTDQRFGGFDELYGMPIQVRMPMELFMGIGYDFIGGKQNDMHNLSGYLEATHPNDADERVHTALEYNFNNLFFLRGGYRFNYDEVGATFGGGVNLEMAGYKLSVDYAYLDYGRLDVTHLFTLGFGL